MGRERGREIGRVEVPAGDRDLLVGHEVGVAEARQRQAAAVGIAAADPFEPGHQGRRDRAAETHHQDAERRRARPVFPTRQDLALRTDDPTER